MDSGIDIQAKILILASTMKNCLLKLAIGYLKTYMLFCELHEKKNSFLFILSQKSIWALLYNYKKYVFEMDSI